MQTTVSFRTSLVLPLICGLFSFVPSLPAQENMDVAGLAEKARTAIKEGRLIEAAELAADAIELDEDNHVPYTLLAISASRLGKREVASGAIETAVQKAGHADRLELFSIWRRIDPGRAKTIADMWAEQGQADLIDGLSYKAAVALEEAWRLAPTNSTWGLQSARSYFQIDDYQVAIPMLREIANGEDEAASFAEKELARIAPLIRKLYAEQMELAKKKLDGKQVQDAETNYLNAVDYDPYRPEAFYSLAKFHLSQKDKGKALAALRLAIRNGVRDQQSVLGEAVWDLRNDSEYLALVEGMFGPSVRERAVHEYEQRLASMAAARRAEKKRIEIRDLKFEEGLRLLHGTEVLMDIKAAKKRFRDAAKEGHLLAKVHLATLERDFNSSSKEQLTRAELMELKKLAELCDPVAQTQLGIAYYYGVGTKEDKEAGVGWLQEAVEHEYPPAFCTLGQIYCEGKGAWAKPEAAVELFRKGALQEHGRSQTWLGFAYRMGKGVEEDHSAALRWFQKAAEQNCAYAFLNLSEILGQGVDVARDTDKATEYLHRASDLGAKEAQHRLAWNYLGKNEPRALELFREASRQGYLQANIELGRIYTSQGKPDLAKEHLQFALNRLQLSASKGDAVAQVLLARMYVYGDGVGKDYQRALDLARKSAKQGNSDGENLLAMMYEKGLGVEKSPADAVKWVKRAAEKGNINAQANLGYCYLKGFGVERNVELALELLKRSAGGDDTSATYRLGMTYLEGDGVEVDANASADWFRKGADLGHVNSMFMLGVLGTKGTSEEQNKEGVDWYLKAAKLGHVVAQNNLGQHLLEGDGIQKNYAEALRWTRKAADSRNPHAEWRMAMIYINGWGLKKSYQEAKTWLRKAAKNDNTEVAGYAQDLLEHIARREKQGVVLP